MRSETACKGRTETCVDVRNQDRSALLDPATGLDPRGAQAQALEKTKVAIAVGGKASFYYLPLSIAEIKGFYKEEGLEVEISDFAGGSRALAAVVGGSADVVSGAYEHTINLQQKGQMFQAFVLQGRAPQIAIAVSAKTMGGYKTVADLKGKKIGVSAPGSSTNMMASYLLATAGLKPSDVSFIGVGTGAGAVTALRSGQIDAISNVEPVMTMLEQSGDIRIIADMRSMKGTQAFLGGPMPAACLYAPLGFVQKHPNTAQALAAAIIRANRWIDQVGPSELIRTVPESYLLGDRGIYLATFGAIRDSISKDGLFSPEGSKTALRLLESSTPKWDSSKVDLAKTYTNEFAQKALAKLVKKA
ncbi:MAG: ABC transporter substrate-binding protein [Betaproteobacteria bacterium]|nr:ABC transporter substrate-binding protein [Betaproteobacteria bacterium]